MDFFPTSTPAMAEETLREQLAAAGKENASLNERVNHLAMQNDSLRMELNEYRIKIGNVKGVIADVYSEDGGIPDYLTEIASFLDIELTKQIAGTATFEISWSAQVPIDFDPDDFEISFDVNCETYEAEDFSWDEENTEVNAEDDY